MFCPKFAAVYLCLFVVSVYSQEPTSDHASSLSEVLGKEYVLDVPDNLEEILQALNYSDCYKKEFVRLSKYPYVMKITEDNGEFLIGAKIELLGKKFHLGNDTVNDVTVSGTTVTVGSGNTAVQMNFTADEVLVDVAALALSGPLLLKASQSEQSSTSDKKDHSQAGPLASSLDKLYVFEASPRNLEILKSSEFHECLTQFISKFPLISKLSEENGEFELTNFLGMYYTKFKLGEQTKDSRGLLTTFTLNGTTLTRVSHSEDDPTPKTSVWKFGPEETQFQAVAGSDATTLTLKARKPKL